MLVHANHKCGLKKQNNMPCVVIFLVLTVLQIFNGMSVHTEAISIRRDFCQSQLTPLWPANAFVACATTVLPYIKSIHLH